MGVMIGGLFMSEPKVKTRSWEGWWNENVNLRWMRTRNQWKGTYPYMAGIAAKVGGSALDVGCETCLAHPHFVELGLEYAGLDITKKFVDYDIERGIDVRLGSALDMPFEDCSFDTVFCKDLLEHIHPDDVRSALSEMMRVARKQVFIVWFKRPKSHGPIVKDHGYLSVHHNLDAVMKVIEEHPRFDGLTYDRCRNKVIWVLKMKAPGVSE